MSNPNRLRNPTLMRTLGQAASERLLGLAGWDIEPFPDLEKAVVVAGPHTSNWDGLVAVLSAATLGLTANIMVKDSLFRWPLGPVLRRLGCIPINRKRNSGVVDQAVEQFSSRDHLVLVVTPEGTRANAKKWKTGFYHIANRAGVPIVLAAADYAKKTLRFPLVLQPTGDIEADMQRMFECFAEVTPRHPEKLSEPVKVLWDKKNR